MKTSILTLLMISLLTLSATAQEKNATKTIEKTEIEKLKEQVEELEKRRYEDSIKHKVYNEFISLDNQVEKYKQEVTEKISDINWFMRFTGGGALLTLVVSVLTFYYGFLRSVKQYSEEQAQKYVQQSLENTEKSINYLNELVKERSIEDKIKQEYKIIIFRPSNRDSPKTSSLYALLTSNGFRVMISELNDRSTLGAKEIAFINNWDNEFEYNPNSDQDLLRKFILGLNDQSALFYFNTNGKQIKPENLQCYNFSTNVTTVYHNLIGLLRHKYLVVDRKG